MEASEAIALDRVSVCELIVTSDDPNVFSWPWRLLRCWSRWTRKLCDPDVGAGVVPAIGVRTEIASAGKRSIVSGRHATNHEMYTRTSQFGKTPARWRRAR